MSTGTDLYVWPMLQPYSGQQKANTRDRTPYNRPSNCTQQSLPQAPEAERTLLNPADAHILDSDRSPLPTNAQEVTQMTAMFWSPRSVINAGLEIRMAMEGDNDDTLRATAPKSRKLEFWLYDKLDRLQPDLFDMLATESSSFSQNVRKKLKDGRNGAKAEDNSKVKNALPHLREWQPSLKELAKEDRGLNHPECARLLAPITVNMDDQEEQRQFMECSNPPMVAKHWPCFIYEGAEGNPDKPSEGLLKGKLLVKAANIILKSPSSELQPLSLRGTAKRGQKGIASKYHLTNITPAFLAYVSVVVCFALSSELSFNEDGRTFNYIEFYTQLREYLEAPKFKKQAMVLMDWWNWTLFPDSYHISNNHSKSNGSRPGMLDLLEAEVEGKEESASGSDSD